MWRAVLAAIVGYIVWWAIGIAGFIALRSYWHDYALVEPTLAFTLSMRLARLLVGVACGLGAGIVLGLIARRRTLMPWVIGVVILAQFLPSHYQLWAKFPVWYHLFFLLTLAPLIALGARWALSWVGRPTIEATPARFVS
jgi:hypothetical protein